MAKRNKTYLKTEYNVHPEQIKVWKGMIPSEKLQIANALYWTAWEAKTAWLSQVDPSLTEEQLEENVRDIFVHATT
jgi:hypothetical protein